MNSPTPKISGRLALLKGGYDEVLFLQMGFSPELLAGLNGGVDRSGSS
jgi:hypothetical protein